MPGKWTSLLLFFAALWGAAVLRHSPLLYGASSGPTGSWANSPINIVPTMAYADNEGDLFVAAAGHMALLHNTIIRGFNSIHQQASHVKPQDAADFLSYTRTWLKFLRAHHATEEATLFPVIKDVLEDQSVLGEMHHEHERLHGGLSELDKLIASTDQGAPYDARQLLDILESLRPTLEYHMHHEVSSIAELSRHSNAPARNSAEATAAGDLMATWGKNSISKGGLFDMVPFFLLNTDSTVDDGRWVAWPGMPKPVRWALVNVAGAVHGGWWRFASCNGHGRPRQLYATPVDDEAEAKNAEL
ncbi:hypothetical protein RJ55_04964 [Drechmeria coniospora]|nr:hypothetical protein RJ55_04964 [Drechmeria coniospora]